MSELSSSTIFLLFNSTKILELRSWIYNSYDRLYEDNEFIKWTFVSLYFGVTIFADNALHCKIDAVFFTDDVVGCIDGFVSFTDNEFVCADDLAVFLGD